MKYTQQYFTFREEYLLQTGKNASQYNNHDGIAIFRNMIKNGIHVIKLKWLYRKLLTRKVVFSWKVYICFVICGLLVGVASKQELNEELVQSFGDVAMDMKYDDINDMRLDHFFVLTAQTINHVCVTIARILILSKIIFYLCICVVSLIL